jgi:long-subunit fatty acid transport protein
MKSSRFALIVVFGLCLTSARIAGASLIQVPDIGGRNTALGGNDVAYPTDGPGILLSNSAGAVDQTGTSLNYSLLVAFSNARYTNGATGYDTKSSEVPVLPTLWLSSDYFAPWHVGVGLYGSVGAAFNFPGSPAAGVPNRFFSELTILQLGLVAGREIAPGLRVAVQPAPTYGRLRVHFPSPLGPVSYDVQGMGMSGGIGLLYDVGGATLGVSYRSPGIVYMSGDGDIANVGEDVRVRFHTPQSVAFGFARDLASGLKLVAEARWSDYSEFEKSTVRFDHTHALDSPVIAASRDTFRYGVGLDYAMADWAHIRAGISREPWMIEASALSPLLSDYTDTWAAIGASFDVGRWTIEGTIGDGVYEDRVVTASDNPTFPGHYQLEAAIAGFAITYRMN